MKDLLRDVKELEAAIAHAKQVAETAECECAHEHEQLAEWLNELLEIKNARVASKSGHRSFQD